MVDDTEQPDQRVVLVRHAETAWSLSGQHTGATDLPLTEDGRAATHHLRHRLGGRRCTRVLTSPLCRALVTCEIAGFGHDAEVHPELTEWDYGAYESRTTAGIRLDRPGWDIWRDGAPDGETPHDVRHRTDRVIEDLLGTCAGGGDVLVFGHGHSLTALTVRWLGLSIGDGRHFRLGTGGISILGWKRGLRVLEVWNDRSHMPGST